MANEHRSGPVRSTAAREAILDATSRLFHAQGYDRLTIEGIAKEAGVGKQTIYRWWSSRGALIADCLVDGRLIPVDFVVPDTGDLFADVETWLQSVFSILASAQGQALLQSLVAAAAEDAAVGAHLGSSLGVEQHLSERLRGGSATASCRRMPRSRRSGAPSWARSSWTRSGGRAAVPTASSTWRGTSSRAEAGA